MTGAFAIQDRRPQGIMRRIFGPVIDPRVYLRIFHLVLMFPLGIAYFVFFVTAFSFGGAMVWTFVGPPVLLLAMWVSLRLADGEAWLVTNVVGVEIRRPPQRLEDVDSFRQRLWMRAIDPTTWTGLLYELVQFPLGIGYFVAATVMFSVSGAMVFSPLIQLITDEPINIISSGDGWAWQITEPVHAIPMIPVGIVAWFLSVHILLGMSALHARWAKLMLGSKGRSRPASLEPDRTTPPQDPPGTSVQPPEPEAVEEEPIDRTIEARVVPFEPEEVRPAAVVEAEDPPEIAELTPREREVTLLLARGMSNADIAEVCFISEGTVKTHVKRILSKLDLHDRTQVVVFAYERRLVTPSGAEAESSAWTGG